VVAGFGTIAALLGVKVGAKFASVWPLTRVFRLGVRDGNYTTFLMSTGLTFGSISALSGLTNHIINQEQYTILVTVVIGSAVVPTMIAQTWFRPRLPTSRELAGISQAARSDVAVQSGSRMADTALAGVPVKEPENNEKAAE